MGGCSGSFGRHYEIFVPHSVDETLFPSIQETIRRALRSPSVEVTVIHHDGPLDEEETHRHWIIGLATEHVYVADDVPHDSFLVACQALHRAFRGYFSVKFTDAGAKACTFPATH